MRKILLAVLVLVVVGVVGAGLWVYLRGEGAIRSAIETQGPKYLGAPVRLASVSLSPFSGAARLEGLSIGNPEGFSDAQAIDVGEIAVDLQPRSLFGEMIEIDRIALDAPVIRAEPSRDGLNLTRLQSNLNAYLPPPDPDAPPVLFRVGEFTMTGAEIVVGGGAVGFSDQSVSLADIRMTDIGGSDGITGAQLARHIGDAVLPQVRQALASQAGQRLLSQAVDRMGLPADVVSGSLEGVKSRVEDTVSEKTGNLGKKAKDALGGLLGGKSDKDKDEDDSGGDGGN